MPHYDATAYDPPAPVARVTLRPSDGGAAILDNVLLVIDTGADITLLPRSAMTRLGLAPVPDQRYALYGFDGSRTETDAVDLDLLLLGHTFRGRYLLTDDAHGLLGRDVLNGLRLTFDGPGLTWDAAGIFDDRG